MQADFLDLGELCFENSKYGADITQSKLNMYKAFRSSALSLHMGTASSLGWSLDLLIIQQPIDIIFHVINIEQLICNTFLAKELDLRLTYATHA